MLADYHLRNDLEDTESFTIYVITHKFVTTLAGLIGMPYFAGLSELQKEFCLRLLAEETVLLPAEHNLLCETQELVKSGIIQVTADQQRVELSSPLVRFFAFPGLLAGKK
jgi:hypothetical protein